MKTTPFTITIDQAVIDDLRDRLANTRWMMPSTSGNWDRGADIPYMQSLVRYWHDEFDWRAQEAAINRLAHFKTEIDGTSIHFIHERGKGTQPLPIVLTHGFPDSFLRFSKLIPLLTDPASHGGDPGDAFDVVVPSLPGYGFSERPEKAGVLFDIAKWWATLMTERLGYAKFAAHGGDWGSTITEHLARSHASHLVGIHLTDVPFAHLFKKPKDLSPNERRFIEQAEKWQQKEGAYAAIQSTKPQSLACGMNDSPAGLAAWLVDKFREWSDCNGDVESRFTRDELLTNATLYWVTQTIGSSFLLYYDAANAGAMTWIAEAIKAWTGSSDVPTGFALFPKDILPPPREWAERFFNIQRWTEMPRGGHFAAMEEPQLLAEDIRTFFRPLRLALANAA
jgi:pimeloyl-ACP methyl ester carboxylesterase